MKTKAEESPDAVRELPEYLSGQRYRQCRQLIRHPFNVCTTAAIGTKSTSEGPLFEVPHSTATQSNRRRHVPIAVRLACQGQ